MATGRDRFSEHFDDVSIRQRLRSWLVHPMTKRLGQLFISLWAALSLSFVLIRLIPGGPLAYLRFQLAQQTDMTMEEINRLAEIYLSFRPDEPLYVQYIRYMTNVLQGDLGQSFLFNEPVVNILMGAMPYTMFVLSVALLLNFSIGLSLGALMAYREGEWFDVGGTVFSVVLSSVPYYVFALVMLFVLAFQWGVFPTGSRYAADVTPGFNLDFIFSAMKHATLPIISLVFTSFASLGMRANSISVLESDYIRVARLRGLPENRIVLHYVLHNAVLPMYTGLLIAIGTVFGGSVILERIFTYPGAGWFLIRGVEIQDYPLMMGGFVIITVGVLTGVLLADLTYQFIDPRAGGVEDESF